MSDTPTKKRIPALHGLIACGMPLEKLENEPVSTCILDPEFRLSYCNLAWDKFAIENDGPELVRERVLGNAILDVASEPLNSFYRKAFRGVQSGLGPWEHDYECSSADKFRLCHMRALPLRNSYVLVENSVRVERLHEAGERSQMPPKAEYRNDQGAIVMCAHCRRTRRHSALKEWDWVPDYLRKMPPNVSHGLCMTCRLFYFGA